MSAAADAAGTRIVVPEGGDSRRFAVKLASGREAPFGNDRARARMLQR